MAFQTHSYYLRALEGGWHDKNQQQIWLAHVWWRWKKEVVYKEEGALRKRIGDFTKENTAAIWANFVTIVIVTQEIISWSSSNKCQGLHFLLKSIFTLFIHSLNHLQLLLHSLKPSSSTHSLQINCIGFTGLEFTHFLGIVLKPNPYTLYSKNCNIFSIFIRIYHSFHMILH